MLSGVHRLHVPRYLAAADQSVPSHRGRRLPGPQRHGRYRTPARTGRLQRHRHVP